MGQNPSKANNNLPSKQRHWYVTTTVKFTSYLDENNQPSPLPGFDFAALNHRISKKICCNEALIRRRKDQGGQDRLTLEEELEANLAARQRYRLRMAAQVNSYR